MRVHDFFFRWWIRDARMKFVAHMILILASLLFVAPCLGIDDAITPSPRLPATTPWDLEALSRPPSFQWVDAEGPVRSLFYVGQPYGGKSIKYRL